MVIGFALRIGLTSADMQVNYARKVASSVQVSVVVEFVSKR